MVFPLTWRDSDGPWKLVERQETPISSTQPYLVPSNEAMKARWRSVREIIYKFYMYTLSVKFRRFGTNQFLKLRRFRFRGIQRFHACHTFHEDWILIGRVPDSATFAATLFVH